MRTVGGAEGGTSSNLLSIGYERMEIIVSRNA
jgi:hypothetical protein